mgnify:CR=1 FL=1
MSEVTVSANELCPVRGYMARGFKLTFSNGITMSVRFGEGSYCDEHRWADNVLNKVLYGSKEDLMEVYREPWGASNAEVAVFYSKSVVEGRTTKFAKLTEDPNKQVKGWCTPEEIAKIMEFVSRPTTYINNEGYLAQKEGE